MLVLAQAFVHLAWTYTNVIPIGLQYWFIFARCLALPHKTCNMMTENKTGGGTHNGQLHLPQKVQLAIHRFAAVLAQNHLRERESQNIKFYKDNLTLRRLASLNLSFYIFLPHTTRENHPFWIHGQISNYIMVMGSDDWIPNRHPSVDLSWRTPVSHPTEQQKLRKWSIIGDGAWTGRSDGKLSFGNMQTNQFEEMKIWL